MTNAALERVLPQRRRRWPWIVGAIVAVFAAVLAWGLIPPSRKPFDDEVARLRAAGFATTFAEWYGPMPPAEENGAVDLVAALAWLDATLGKESTWGVTGPWDNAAADPWEKTATETQLAALREKLAAARPFFDRVDAALAKPRFKFEVTVDASGMTNEPGIRFLQRSGKLLRARALAANSAEDRLGAIRGLARLGLRPDSASIIDHVIGSVQWQTAARIGRDAIAAGALSPSEVNRALAPWPSERQIDLIGELARSDIAWFPDIYDATLSGRSSIKPPSLRERAGAAFERLADRLAGRPVRPEAPDPSPAALAEHLRHLSELALYRPGTHRDTRAWADDAHTRAPRSASSTTGSTRAIVQFLTRSDAAFRVAAVALAVAERHETTGAWPAFLDEIRGEFPGGVPLDPYTDAPFVYEVTDDTVRIASIGRLPQDDPIDDATLRERGLLWEFRR